MQSANKVQKSLGMVKKTKQNRKNKPTKTQNTLQCMLLKLFLGGGGGEVLKETGFFGICLVLEV